MRRLVLAALILFAFAPQAHAALPATSALPQNASIVSRWKLGEAAGASRADSVGSNTLTDNNTVGQGAGSCNSKNASFVVASSEFLSITNGAQTGLNIGSNMTISVLMTRTTNTEYMLGKWDNTVNNRQYLFGYGTDAGAEGLFFYNSSAGNNQAVVGDATTIPVSTTHVVTVVYNAPAGSAAFYVDGSQVSTTQTGLFTSNFSSAAQFDVGGFSGASRFDGSLQDAIIWNVALSSTDVSNLYRAYISCTLSTSFWQFDWL